MRRRVPELGGREAGFGGGVREVVEGAGVDLGDAGAEEGADEELEALEFGLGDDEAEVGFGVRVAGLLFDELNLCAGEVSVSWCAWGRGESGIPAYVSSPEYVPSRRPAMAVFLEHSAP